MKSNMTKYEIVCSYNQIYFIDAVDKETAEEEALAQFELAYDLAPGQGFIEESKEYNGA